MAGHRNNAMSAHRLFYQTRNREKKKPIQVCRKLTKTKKGKSRLCRQMELVALHRPNKFTTSEKETEWTQSFSTAIRLECVGPYDSRTTAHGINYCGEGINLLILISAKFTLYFTLHHLMQTHERKNTVGDLNDAFACRKSMRCPKKTKKKKIDFTFLLHSFVIVNIREKEKETGKTWSTALKKKNCFENWVKWKY